MARKRTSVAELTQILNQPVNITGEGEHPVIQEILDPNTAHKPPAEIYELMKAFNDLILNQQTLITRLADMSDKVTNLIERVEKYEEASKRWEEDRKKFLEEVNERANALRITDPDEKEKFVIERAKELSDIYAEVREKSRRDDKARYDKLDSEPKVVVRGVGTVQQVVKNGIVHSELAPDAIQIGRRVYVFPPNVDVEVPASVAEEYKLLCRERELLEKRKQLLAYDKAKELNTLAKEWQELSSEYRNPSEPLTGVG